MKAMTLTAAQELIGKTIVWSAPAAEGNSTYGGKAIIEAVKEGKRPISATILEGDNLNFAICENGEDVDFSDYGRGVSYELVDNYMVNDTETGNCVIYSGESLADAIAEILNDVESEDSIEWDLYKNGERVWCGKVNTLKELKSMIA